LVSESGIGGRADVERLSPLVDAFLVGSSLMRSAEPAQSARELIFGRTKLWGLNGGADVRAARPAAFAGLVFVPGSPRHVTGLEAAPLAGLARKCGMRPVGVFRDAPVRVVADLAALMNLHAVQLHGTEDIEYVRELRREVPRECELWTAVSVGRDLLASRGGDRLVFDNADGGSGRTFDWSLVEHHPDLARSVVAGGIGPRNALAAQRLGAYAVDVGSAVDLSPGRKSSDKIADLFDALRPASRRRLRECA
jgi:indole-3-glycerol phosphate synthase/phosphoribosylanthranilate isomerase